MYNSVLEIGTRGDESANVVFSLYTHVHLNHNTYMYLYHNTLETLSDQGEHQELYPVKEHNDLYRKLFPAQEKLYKHLGGLGWE